MKEVSGRIISYINENMPVEGCTVSKLIHSDNFNHVSVFSMAKDTDISAESYTYHKLVWLLSGKVVNYSNKNDLKVMRANDLLVTPTDLPIGFKTDEEAIYIEVSIGRKESMSNMLKSGEIINIKELLPYKQDKIINMDLINDPKLKFVVMSFDENTGLSEHAAPGEALVFALDGEAIIGYEGKEYHLHEGEQFKFDKNGRHYVKALTKFKMALLLTLE